MSRQDREIINKLIEELSQFRGEIQGMLHTPCASCTRPETDPLMAPLPSLRLEVNSFKEQTMERCQNLETRCETRQTNPDTCTTGRTVKEHIRNHNKKTINTHTILTLVLEAGMLTAVILIALFK